MRWLGVLLVLAGVAFAEEHALLIGCTDYPNLKSDPYYEASIRLFGPENDVAMLGDTLRRFLGVEKITTLAGWPADKAKRPTRRNILHHLDRLAKDAKKGDRVLVYYAGHGSQQPDKDGDELDGLDEILLPADVKGWNGGKGEVENSITDDELGRKLRAVRDRGATVWLILDCCHAGGGVRAPGGSAVRVRGLGPAVLGVPEQALARGRGGIDSRVVRREDLDGMVAMYGAQSYSTAPEMQLPKNTADARWHGVFTYVLVGQLQRTGGNLDFRELHARALAVYRTLYHGTAPQAEGELGRQVNNAPGGAASTLLLRREEGGFVLNAGRLAGIDEGTILAAAQVGQVRVVEAGLSESRCEFLTRDGVSPDVTVVRAEVVSYAVKGLRLKLQVVGGPLPEGARGLKFVRVVDKRRDADWVVTLRADGARLEPARGEGPRLASGRADLAVHLHAVFRTENLKRFSGAGLMDPLPRGLTVAMLREDGARVEPGSVVHPGESIAIDLRNGTDTAHDVTVLAIDSQCGVVEIFPRDVGDLRVPARSATQRIGSFRVLDNTLGIEHVVVIAIPRRPAQDPAWFGWLAQPTIPTERGGGDALDALLRAMAFGDGVGRGHRVAPAQACAALLTWRTAWGAVGPPKTFPTEPRAVARARGAGDVPDAWAIGPRACVRNGVLLAGGDTPCFVLVDVDGDAKDAPVDELVAKRSFDAEAAFHFLADRRIAFYDIDNSGDFDLILIDDDTDPEADVTYRKIDGTWQRDDDARLPWFSTHHLRFKGGAEQALAKFKELAR